MPDSDLTDLERGTLGRELSRDIGIYRGIAAGVNPADPRRQEALDRIEVIRSACAKLKLHLT